VPGSGPSCSASTTTTTMTTTTTTTSPVACNDPGGACGTCGSGTCVGPPDCASGIDRCVASGCSAPNCIACGSDQDCAASPGTICVGGRICDLGGCSCLSLCLPPCSPSEAFLDE
jgi:hypothetical protein